MLFIFINWRFVKALLHLSFPVFWRQRRKEPIIFLSIYRNSVGIGELHYRSLSSVFFVLLLFRDWGGGRWIRGVSFFCVFYPYDLPSGPSDPTFTREGRSPESPKGAAKAEPKVVQLFYLCFIWVRKRILDSQFLTGNPPFWNLENVLLSGRTAGRDGTGR